jgi:hypothetical protein
MASPADVPRVSEPIAGSGGFVTKAWVDFFLKLASVQSSQDLAALYAALAQRVAELEDGQGLSFKILGQESIAVNGVPQPNGAVIITLQNDTTAPGNTQFYGSGPGGIKGWFPVAGAITATSGQLTKTVGGDGVTDLGLANVTDTGAGTLLATTFDAKGRRTGSRAATITGTTNQINVVNGDAAAGLPTLTLAAPVLASLDKADSALQPGAAHNTSLSGLQGGTSGERYHLTLAQVAEVNASVQSVTAGPGITVNNTNPRNPIISAKSGTFIGGVELTSPFVSSSAGSAIVAIPGMTFSFVMPDRPVMISFGSTAFYNSPTASNLAAIILRVNGVDSAQLFFSAAITNYWSQGKQFLLSGVAPGTTVNLAWYLNRGPDTFTVFAAAADKPYIYVVTA